MLQEVVAIAVLRQPQGLHSKVAPFLKMRISFGVALLVPSRHCANCRVQESGRSRLDCVAYIVLLIRLRSNARDPAARHT